MSILNLIGGTSFLPKCNNIRRYSMGVEKMKPEYHSNENFQFVDTFGVPPAIKNDKHFIDVSELNHQQSKHQQKNSSSKMLAHNHLVSQKNIENTCTKQPQETIQEMFIISDIPKQSGVQHNDHKSNDLEDKFNCNITQTPKKTKKKSRKKNMSRNFTKKSKRESDRNVCYPSSKLKHKNKRNWHKKSLKMEIMEFDLSELNSSMESPQFSLSEMCIIAPIGKNSSNLQNGSSTEPNLCVSFKSMPEQLKEEDAGTSTTPQHSEDQVDFCISIKTAATTKSKQEENTKSKPDVCISIKAKPSFRNRLPSECDSEDSFIVFESCTNDSDDEEDESYVESSDEGDSDDDSIIFGTQNLRWQPSVCKRRSTNKKVRFAADENLCTVHPMIKWSFAYRKARKSPWEQMALDRSRFENRIRKLEAILSPVLQPSHRNKVYIERFLDAD